MSDDLFSKVYNPDVLSCLANLSNDEVFTSPDVVNQMLDMLPKELFENPDTTFLDPACKTGVFLREIAKRLIKGLENQIPDLQERVDHIFHKQLYGIAITELTSLLSRRGVYCSKYANSEFSITHFENADGNIRFKKTEHTYLGGKCKYCGASKAVYDRGSDYETYAYEFIHGMNVEEIFKMKFDVIIGNPPYQLKVAKSDEQQNAVSLYNLFVEKAFTLKPRYVSMIIPSRWMTGGRGVDSFRKLMVGGNSIKELHDFIDASDCFPGVEIKGGVCFFLWENRYKGLCNYYLHKNQKVYISKRYLDDMNIGMVIRDSRSISIIKKVIENPEFRSFKEIAGSQTPFGIVSSFDKYTSQQTHENTIKIYGNKFIGFTSPKYITKNYDLSNKWKVFAPKAVGSGVIETDKINAFVPEKPSICTQTYIIYGPFDTKEEANNACEYMKTRFFHFLLGQLKNTQQMAPELFKLVPIQDFHESWNDEKLFKKYGLSSDEINYIKQSVWPNQED